MPITTLDKYIVARKSFKSSVAEEVFRIILLSPWDQSSALVAPFLVVAQLYPKHLGQHFVLLLALNGQY